MQANPTPAKTAPDAARVDAVDKVMGRAAYAADHLPPRLAHAMPVPATVGKGAIVSIDVSAASRVKGVLLILTHETMDKLPPPRFLFAGGHSCQSHAVLQSNVVAYRGQMVALVVAETLEAAAEGAARITVRYDSAPFTVRMDDAGAEQVDQARAFGLPMMADKTVGDADSALRQAELVEVDRRYATPPQHQNPIELVGTVAQWDGGRLTVHEPTQAAEAVRQGLALQFGLDPSAVHVISPYIGGGFGQKNSLLPHTAVVAAAARRLGRPVKLVVPRAQAFHAASFRPASEHRVRIGATRDGRMVAAIHETRSQTSRFDLMPALGTEITARMYGIPNFRGHETLVRLDTQTPGFMRAPYEMAASFAFESAVDELAWRLNMDPVALRVLNDTQRDPLSGKPFSSRHLVECLRRGAARIDWARRSPVPRSMRGPDGSLIGLGVAAGAYKAATAPAIARLRLDADGTVAVSVGGHEMGQGIRTAIALTVAGVLGVPAGRVRVALGDTAAPPQHLTAGSWGTATVVPAVQQAATEVRARLIALATGAANSPLRGVAPDRIVLADGKLTGPGGQVVAVAAVLYDAHRTFLDSEVRRLAPGQGGQAMDRAMQGLPAAAGPEYPEFVAMSYAAHFAEVHVHPRTGKVRVARAVGVFDCGRVASPRTARSQAYGGMVWGIGAALSEASEVDRRVGGFLNADIAEYMVPVNADIAALEVDFIDQPDPRLNAAGVKGLGEVASVGAAAAIANAVFHATGQRFSRLPIRPDDVAMQ
jgi:xanthine dehydrogenase YagR molybdenum-binding subunit